MRRILAAVCLMWGATALNGQVLTSLDPASVQVKSGEWFVTANGRYPGDTFVFDGPAGTFAVEASVAETTYAIGWVPQEVLLKSGTYKVTVRGPNGSTDALPFTVTSAARTLPLFLVVPEALYEFARTPKGNYVKFEVTASGGTDPEPKIDCSPASGEFFATGSTKVTCTASTLEERVSDSFTISVIDGPPVFKLPDDIWVRPESDKGTYVKYDVSAYDEVDAKEVAVSCVPETGSLFPIGMNFVECSAKDSVGNTESASFMVNVTTDDPPKL